MPADGTDGRDLLIGEATSDKLSGYGANDRLFGKGGHDTLTGGAGDDLLVGGGGRDTFVFGRSDGDDLIRDFRPGIDTIQFGGVGPREVTLTQGEAGTTVHYGGIAASGPDAGTIVLQGVELADLQGRDWLLF